MIRWTPIALFLLLALGGMSRAGRGIAAAIADASSIVR